MFYKKKQKKKKTELQLLIDKLDELFSIFVRKRDADENGIVKCCTCGKFDEWKYMDCGHCFSRRHYAIRWEVMNTGPQCKSCNIGNQGRQIDFQNYLNNKYGAGTVEILQIKKNNEFHLDKTTLTILLNHFQNLIQ